MRWERNTVLNNEMRMNESWKQSLAFNNDDGKKNVQIIYLKTICIKKRNK